MHWYYAEDSWKGKVIQDPMLTSQLWDLSSGKMGQILGCIPLILGMPVYILYNFDIAHGIGNRITGILHHICFKLNGNNECVLTSCIIEMNTSGVTIKHWFDNTKHIPPMTGVPISPAYSMTAHKSQGQTMTKVIINLKDAHGTEEVYVMISHVKSLDGLFILCPF